MGLFYTQPNFQGNPIYLEFGMHDYPNVGGFGNNKLASFKIPENTTLKLYDRPKQKGATLVYNGPARVATLPSRYINRISGIELIQSPSPFDAKCYTGMSFQGNTILLKPGFYDYPSIGGVGNKQLASFKIPQELIITLYSRPNKQGQKVTFIGPYEMDKMGVEWTNNVSGIEVQTKK